MHTVTIRKSLRITVNYDLTCEMYVIILAVDGRWLWKCSHFTSKALHRNRKWRQPLPKLPSQDEQQQQPWRAAAASGQSAVIILHADWPQWPTDGELGRRAGVLWTLHRRRLLSLTSIRCQIDIAAGRRRLTTSKWRQFDVPVLSGKKPNSR